MAQKRVTNQGLPTPPQAEFENAQLIWRNFSGKGGQFNAEGNRNFNVILPEDVYQDMVSQGWNAKMHLSSESDVPPLYTLPVKVNFKSNRPPQIYLITESGRVALTEETVGMLDFIEIITCDLIINPYYYNTATAGEGFSGWLKTAYITMQEDRFASKYSNRPTSALSAIVGE